MRRCLVLAALLVAPPAGAVTLEWVYVGDPSNAPDTASKCMNSAADCGSVDHAYSISKYEVTNAQYADFLNAKAASDPLGLYNPSMGADPTFGGITRSGVSGAYTYTVEAGFASKPVTFVSFYDALRFANWLNNGQGSASTETGAYTLLGGTAEPSNGNTVARNPGANTFLTTQNEWYKAAYYDAGSASFFDYPTGTNSVTGCVAPGADTGNSANCLPYAYPPGSLTNVGAYALSHSPYGTFDQGGNVWEWNEENSGGGRGHRGGAWDAFASGLGASGPYYPIVPTGEGYSIGFRVATVPEPAQLLLALTGGLVLAAVRRRRA